MTSELIWEPLPPHSDLYSAGDGELECWGCYAGDSISCHGDVACSSSSSGANSTADGHTHNHTASPVGAGSGSGVGVASGKRGAVEDNNAAAPGSPPMAAGCAAGSASAGSAQVGSGGAGGGGGGGGTGTNLATAGLGHSFTKKTFHKPIYCSFCAEMRWGVFGTTGYLCDVCNMLVHEKCLKSIVSPCSAVASCLIDDPCAHVWSDIGQFRRKFCNVCRKRLEDAPAIRCEVCEYYAHWDCQEFVTSNCKNCSTYGTASSTIRSSTPSPGAPQETSAFPPQLHHWREGNLPTNSKCTVCRKSCWSNDCLTGFRCEWCGLTAHPGCFGSIPRECTYGVLRSIMLPAYAVCTPRTNIPMEKSLAARITMDEWSSSGDSKEDSSGLDRKSVKERAEYEDYFVRVYDGNAAYKRHAYRAVPFSKGMTAHAVLCLALKALHMTYHSKSFKISEISEKEGCEHGLDEEQNFHAQLRYDQRRPSVIVRPREADSSRGYIRVYPDQSLQQLLSSMSNMRSTPVPRFKYVPVNRETTARDTLVLVLRKLGLEHLAADNFHLVETSLSNGQVSERVLHPAESPWEISHRLGMDSARALHLTRFYIRPLEDPHGSGVALFVANLKPNLSQRAYEKILLEKLGVEHKWETIDVIYYEYGALVLLYSSGEKAEAAYKVLKAEAESGLSCLGAGGGSEKPILAMILPRILPERMAPDVQPLLILMNVKSGGCQGLELITNFRKLLNPHQVYNLDYGGPLPGLYAFRLLSDYKILVCGGDGTVGWALSCLDNVSQDAKCHYPPMAILPLGTGNDLARVLRWGGGYSGGVDPLTLLRDVVEAEPIKLDRWTLIFHPEEKDKDVTKVALQYELHAANTNEDNASIFVMNNYFGIGVDADLQLDFHAAREENLSKAKFNSRIFNKSIYFTKGVRKFVSRSTCKDLHKQLIIEVDGKVMDLPPVEGIIILNILSWGAGANPWGNVNDRDGGFSKPNHYDGLLEVFGVNGVVHMGQIYSGLRSGLRLAQAGHLRITLKNDLPVQVDGEPWIQSAGQVMIIRSALRATMLRKRKYKPKQRGAAASASIDSSSQYVIGARGAGGPGSSGSAPSSPSTGEARGAVAHHAPGAVGSSPPGAGLQKVASAAAAVASSGSGGGRGCDDDVEVEG